MKMFVLYPLLVSSVMSVHPASVNAGTVDCYSGGKKIFHDESQTVLVSPEWIVVTHKYHDNVILRNNKDSPHCILNKMTH